MPSPLSTQSQTVSVTHAVPDLLPLVGIELEEEGKEEMFIPDDEKEIVCLSCMSQPPHAASLTFRWLTEATEATLQQMAGHPKNTTCPACRLSTPNRKAVMHHIPQHCYAEFCPCGFMSASRDMVLKHQRSQAETTSRIHKVDVASYPAWCEAVGLRTPPQYLPPGFPASVKEPRVVWIS